MRTLNLFRLKTCFFVINVSLMCAQHNTYIRLYIYTLDYHYYRSDMEEYKESNREEC